MKRIFVFVSIIIASGIILVGYNRWFDFSFCNKPIEYRLGHVDERFEVSQDDILKQIKESADIWNRLLGKPLFLHDEKGSLEINLIYNERQANIAQIAKRKSQIEQITQKLDHDLENYEKEKEIILAEYEKLNNEIIYWNSQGGAPKEEFNKIIQSQKALSTKLAVLDQERINVNKYAQNLNNEIDNLNTIIASFNNLVEVTPEEGVYYSVNNKIVIYLYSSEKQFIHTVAHELGHALGLGHVEEPGSIMHPISSPSATLTNADITMISEFCEEQNVFALIKNDTSNFINNFILRYLLT